MNPLNLLPTEFWVFIATAIGSVMVVKLTGPVARWAKAAFLSSGDRLADLMGNQALKTQIRAKMFELEKQLGSDAGKQKFNALVSWAVNIIPGPIDDPLVRAFCQAVYDEAKRPLN